MNQYKYCPNCKEDKNWQYFSPDDLPEQIAYKHRDAINDWNEKTKPQKL